jgi:predicted DsbA family dithiol-disulfide isomerase
VAFPLHPETPLEGKTLAELFADRDVDIPALLDRLKKAAEQAGVPFGNRTHTYNSRRAQELSKWAEEQGKGDDFHMAVFKAYFKDGQNIGRRQVLKALAASLGLDPAEADKVMEQGLYKEAVDRDWNYSRRIGVTAVPTFVANGRGVVGAQPYGELVKLMQAAGAATRA